MIPFIKRLGFSGISALNIEWLKRKSPVNVISPFHHLVSDEPVPYIEKLYAFKNSRQFEADLDYLLRHFRPLTLEEVIAHEQNGTPCRQKGFLICFDDGLRQVHDIAAPILLRKGVPAALFINSAFVDNKDIFYNFKKGLLLDKLDHLAPPSIQAILSASVPLFGRHFDSPQQLRTAIRSVNYLNRHLMDELGKVFGLDFESFRKEQKPFMTTEEIKSLIANGFSVGSHSIDHPLYSLLPLEEQIRQTLVSTAWTVKTFGLPYKAFAFPHLDTGVGNAFFEQMLGTAGHSDPADHSSSGSPLDLILGNTTAMLEKHPRVLHRFIGENPAIPIDSMVKSVLAYSTVRQRLGKSFVVRS